MKINLSREKFTKWFFHFFIINLIVIYILAFRYLDSSLSLQLYVFENDGIVQASFFYQVLFLLFLTITAISYFSLLTLAFLIPSFLAFKLTKKNWLGISLSLLTMGGFILFLLIDLYVFKIYRFHLNGFLFKMLFSQYNNQIFYFSKSEWQYFYSIVSGILLFEILLAYLLWYKSKFDFSKFVYYFLFLSMNLIIVSFSSASLYDKYLLRRAIVAFPFYPEIFRHIFFKTKTQMRFYAYSQLSMQPQFSSHPLNYPTYPQNCDKPQRLPNIIIVLIDTWRFEALGEKMTPNISALMAENLAFTNHLSGGNATQPGVFSLFYSLPGMYWTSVLEQKKSPVLINHLLSLGYQFGIYASANLTVPDFASTIFRSIPNLETNTAGTSTSERDKKITDKFLSFLETRDKSKPIFSFIFYDSAHQFCDKFYAHGPFQPVVKECTRFLLHKDYESTPLQNRYRNSVHFIDQQIGRILDGIKKANLYDDSIIIITGDHGEEFNDNHNNYWGHASNFTKFQLQTPLIIHWPGKARQQFSYRTTHYDLVPTLLKEAFSCESSPEGYSNGLSLFDAQSRDPLIVSANYNYAYLYSNVITQIFPSDNFERSDFNTNQFISYEPKKEELISALQKANRFYKDINPQDHPG
ncbi:Inner membrane protein YejM [Legionella massiliensis]|uniref:Inner membrane protein YejM n=1 Tax=Legionella massiliensis TaxID=1034943 RepID=A0A078L132_9GAMM|nr:sulfatase-like hydrolase/transferase [Legionella massiliensis]CDZ77778.1 Inner membrane protein YejM [Legionella massiliensis]CEE13516.1 Inner membrane protein YejM [Legionella massiliensis]